MRIIVTALFAASSEPLIAWSMAGLSGAFLDNELSYEALFRNVIGLTAVLLLYCHWMSFLIILIFLLPLTINNLLMPQRIAACQERSMQTLVGMTVKNKRPAERVFYCPFPGGGEAGFREHVYALCGVCCCGETDHEAG